MRALTAVLLGTAGLGAILTWAEGAAHNGAAWLLAHPQIDAGISLWLLVSIANKLQSNPATATGSIEYVLRKAIDVVSVLPHADAKGVIGGALARYLAPGPAQAALQLLFGWFNLPAAGSTPNALPNADAVPVPAPPPARGFARLTLLTALLLSIGVGLGSCAFWRSIKADEIDCLHNVESSVQTQIIPEITLLLATGGAGWPQALAVLEKDAGDAVLCAVAAVVNGLERAGAPSAAPPPSPGSAPTARALVADPSLGLFCALAERDGSPLPDQCIALSMASKAAGRARAYLGAAKKKPVLTP